MTVTARSRLETLRSGEGEWGLAEVGGFRNAGGGGGERALLQQQQQKKKSHLKFSEPSRCSESFTERPSLRIPRKSCRRCSAAPSALLQSRVGEEAMWVVFLWHVASNPVYGVKGTLADKVLLSAESRRVFNNVLSNLMLFQR